LNRWISGGLQARELARNVFVPTAVNRTTSFVSSSKRFDAQHRADAELRMPDFHPSLSAMPVD